MSRSRREALKALVSAQVRALLGAGHINPLVVAADYRPHRIGSWAQARLSFRNRPGWFSAQAEYEGLSGSN